MSKRCGRGCNNLEQAVLGFEKRRKNIGVLFKNECCHFCKKKKWQTYWTECNNHNNRFCDWPFRRDGMAGYEKHKKVTCSKACAQWRKNNNTLVSKKKEAKNDGVLIKNASWMILMKIEEPKRRGRIGRNATTTKDRIRHPRFRRGETAVMLIF